MACGNGGPTFRFKGTGRLTYRKPCKSQNSFKGSTYEYYVLFAQLMAASLTSLSSTFPLQAFAFSSLKASLVNSE